MAEFLKLNCQLGNIIMKILENKNLDKLIRDGNQYLEPNDPLIYNVVYPYAKMDNTKEKQGVFLNVFFDDFNLDKENVFFKNHLLTISVICHTELWAIKGEETLRPYSIMHEIDKTFNQARISGIGKANFEKARYIVVNSYYSGYELYYRVHDWNYA